MSASLFLVERTPGPEWAVVTATRPISSLRLGTSTIAQRIQRWTNTRPNGVLVRGPLKGFQEEGSLPSASPPPDAGPSGTLFWNSRAIPDPSGACPEFGARPAVVEIDGRYAGLWLPPGRPLPSSSGDLPDGRDAAARPSITAEDGTVPIHAVAGAWIDAPWDLIELNPRILLADLEAFHGVGADGRPTHHRYEGNPGVFVERHHPIWVEEDVDIGYGVVLDARGGPIKLDQGVRVSGPARLVGPLHVAWDSWILGGSIATSSIGPVCKVNGEVSSTVMLGWSNKSHDGHLGHALVGRWVNLGAGTSNSDLRNDYAPVKVTVGGERIDTGIDKLGAMIGDHVKTGIGTLLPTGAIIGAGSQLASGGFAPSSVPPLTWLTDRGGVPYRFDRFEVAMRAAMARRYVVPGDSEIEILRRLHAEVHGSRGEGGA
ncbi:MAG TPA: putative sugar nucleotidyl transferase [Longimicrobiales bacterium]|nr:putative sugar nucleotidyl transferase [Longimicrobiales bacterium]